MRAGSTYSGRSTTERRLAKDSWEDAVVFAESMCIRRFEGQLVPRSEGACPLVDIGAVHEPMLID
jgi:hypothetical protein